MMEMKAFVLVEIVNAPQPVGRLWVGRRMGGESAAF